MLNLSIVFKTTANKLVFLTFQQGKSTLIIYEVGFILFAYYFENSKTKSSVIKYFLEFPHSFKILTIFPFPTSFMLKRNEFDDFIPVLFGY